MRTVLEHQIIIVRCFDNLIQSKYVLVDQLSVYLYLCLQHLKVGTSEFFKLNHFYGVPFVNTLDLYAFIDDAGEAFAQFVLSVVLVYSHFDLALLESMQLLQSFLLSIVARRCGLILEIGRGNSSTVIAH